MQKDMLYNYELDALYWKTSIQHVFIVMLPNITINNKTTTKIPKEPTVISGLPCHINRAM